MVKLFVGNLPPSATNQSLREIFKDYKDLKDYKLISNYGFVYLETDESAIHAVNNLNGLEYRGFPISVDFAKDSRDAKRKMPTSMGNFKPPFQEKPIVTPLMNEPNRFGSGFKDVYSDPYALGESESYSSGPISHNPNPYNLPFYGDNNSLNYNPGFNRPKVPNFEYGHDYNHRYPRSLNMYNCDDRYDEAYNSFSHDDYIEDVDPEYYPSKRPRPNFVEDDLPFSFDNRDRSHGYRMPPQSASNYLKNPNWYDRPRGRKPVDMLIDRNDQFLMPRMKYKMVRSYIDEYEDETDYTSIDPYPTYLKQYRK